MTNRLERWKVAWEGVLGEVGGEPLQCGVLETRYKFILHVTVWEANLKCRSDLITPLMAWQGVPLPTTFTHISLGFKVVSDLETSYPLFVPAHSPLPCFTFQQQKMICVFPLLGCPLSCYFVLISAGTASSPSSLCRVLCRATFNSSIKSLFKNNPIFQEASNARMVDTLHQG